jgi:membrane fusion protein, heavy metal efflux system
MKLILKFVNETMLILFVSVISFTSCSNGAKQVSGSEEVLPDDIVEMRADQIKLADVELGKIEYRSISNILKVNGNVSVAPQNIATVCMPLGGFIKTTTLVPGNYVVKGQTLAVIENQDFVDIQLNYLEAKNKLSFAEADFKRHSELFKADVYSEQNLQQVTLEYKNQKAVLKSLEQKLLLIGIDPSKLNEDNISSSVNLVSPISGNLKSVNVNIGKYVSPTDVLFEIVNTDKLFISLTLFEKNADKVIAGQKVKFFINNETEEHNAVVTQVGKSVNDDKTFRVYAEVESSCRNLLPGMYVQALIEESSDKVISLPNSAVVNFNDKDYIFKFEKDKVESDLQFTEYKMIEVEKGRSDAGYTEIRLPAGESFDVIRVVVKGAYNLLSAKKNAGEMAC